MKTMFIINPVSGKGLGSRPEGMIRQIKSAYTKAEYPYAVRIWDAPERLDSLLEEAVAEGYEVVVAAGGDGTIHEIAKRLVGTNIALGVIPIGSGNGLARHLGYQINPRQAISQLLKAEVKQIDLGDFGGVTFINNAGIGIDAAVAEAFTKAKKRNFSTYIRLTAQSYFNFKPIECRMVVDGEREYHFKNVMLLDIANGPEWGNGAKIAPFSKIDDGYLEAVIMEKPALHELPRLTRQLFSGKLYRYKGIRYIRGKSFLIERPNAGHAHVDGEYVEAPKQILCQVMENSIRVLSPRTGRPTGSQGPQRNTNDMAVSQAL